MKFKCKSKCTAGIVAIVVGLAAILFSMNAMHRIAAAKGDVKEINSWLPKNKIGNSIGNKLNEKASAYDTIVELLFYGGIIVVIVGGVLVYKGRKNRR